MYSFELEQSHFWRWKSEGIEFESQGDQFIIRHKAWLRFVVTVVVTLSLESGEFSFCNIIVNLVNLILWV